jgi:flagellar protein FliS
MESRILSAQPVEIVEMLYQVAVKGLDSAISHLHVGDALARSREVSRAQEAVNELMMALDHNAGATFSRTLAALYAYVQQQILKGHSQPSEQALRNAHSVLSTLLDGWTGVREKLAEKTPPTSHSTVAAAEEAAAVAPVRPANDPHAAYQEEPVTASRDWNC